MESGRRDHNLEKSYQLSRGNCKSDVGGRARTIYVGAEEPANSDSFTDCHLGRAGEILPDTLDGNWIQSSFLNAMPRASWVNTRKPKTRPPESRSKTSLPRSPASNSSCAIGVNF
jgi:hypothetical protein